MNTTTNEPFLNPQGLSRYLRADVIIARKPDMISSRLDATHLTFSPGGEQSDEAFKAELLAELSNMIRHQDDSTVPHEYDLQLKESHINWGASGDAITILLDVSQAVPAAIIGFYVERILAKFASDRKVHHSRTEAIELARSRIATAYSVNQRDLAQVGEEELRDGGWNISFRGNDGTTFEVAIASRGVTYTKRQTD